MVSWRLPGTIFLLVVVSVLVIPSTGSPTKLGPVAAFTYNPCVMCAAPGDVVMFNANWSIATSDKTTIASYTWNFGDGTAQVSTTNPEINHMFGMVQPGEWKVSLTVQDSNNMNATVTQEVVFLTAPVFTFQPLTPEINQDVFFNASATKIYGNQTGQAPLYQWNFGDETTGSGIMTEHAYSTVGAYRITLTVQTRDGNAMISKTIIVSPDPPPGGGGGGRSLEL